MNFSEACVKRYFKERKNGFESHVEIARWKLDNRFENILGKLGDRYALWKKAYVGYYRLLDREYYRRGMNIVEREIKRFVGNASKKEYNLLAIDMVYSLHRFGASFEEYFLFGFRNLSAYGRNQFITDKLRYAYYEVLNDSENMHIFWEKDKTYEKYRHFYSRDLLKVTENNYDAFCRFVTQHSRFVVKPVNGSCGYGVELFDREDWQGNLELFETLLDRNGVVLEGLIQGHGEMKRLHPDSVNTIRVMTVKTKKVNEVFFAVLRVGRNNAFVDNATAGGIFACIDLETGVVKTPGYDLDMKKYMVHPDSGLLLVGFRIPMWESLLSRVNEMADVLPTQRCIGWDMALSEAGWVMVEANPGGMISYEQVAFNRGYKTSFEILIKDW